MKATFRIDPRQIAYEDVRLSQTDFIYNGDVKTPSVSVTDGRNGKARATMKLAQKEQSPPGSTDAAFYANNTSYSGIPDTESYILYKTHVQNDGWQDWKRDGEMSGTSRSLRLEGIEARLGSKAAGNVRYKTHVQNIGWEESWRKNGEMSGTSGKALRLEAICMELEGEAASRYDIYYRTHCQNLGWLG